MLQLLAERGCQKKSNSGIRSLSVQITLEAQFSGNQNGISPFTSHHRAYVLFLCSIADTGHFFLILGPTDAILEVTSLLDQGTALSVIVKDPRRVFGGQTLRLGEHEKYEAEVEK